MNTTIELSTVMSCVQKKGVTLNNKQKAELKNLFDKADEIEQADGMLSTKELSYFVSHANKALKIGNAAEIAKQRISEIDNEIKDLKKRKKSTACKQTVTTSTVATAAIGGGVAAGVLYAGGATSVLAAAAVLTGGVAIGAAVGLGLGYAAYKLFFGDTKDYDKNIEQQNKRIDSQIEQLRQERKNLESKYSS